LWVKDSLEEQKRIAAILDKADAIRRKRSLAIALTEELLRSTFLEMFGDPVTNPKGWKIDKIGEVTKVETGRTPSREKSSFYGGDICWIKTTEVNGSVIYETEEKLTQEGLKASNCKIFPKDTLIVAMYGQGATRGRSAKLAIEASTNQACAAILPSNTIKTDYLWMYLKLSYHQLRNLGRGGNQPNLNLSMIRDFQRKRGSPHPQFTGWGGRAGDVVKRSRQTVLSYFID
jgi:type I restriction enzyme, S subunit